MFDNSGINIPWTIIVNSNENKILLPVVIKYKATWRAENHFTFCACVSIYK